MINGALLAIIATAGLVNGLYTVGLPPWRQVLFLVIAAAAYVHGRRIQVRYEWQLIGGVAVLGVVIGFVDLHQGINALMTYGAFVVLPWLVGRSRRQQAELLTARAERLARLERERELVAERAQAQERARIATDMHDSLGHELALIALRAGVLELAQDMTEINREAAAALRRNAVDATDKLRQTIGILREESAPVEPLDESIAALVERAAEAGMEVHLEPAPVELPALMARTAHRVVQEALTNAARYAPGTAVNVRIDITDAVAKILVRNEHGTIDATSGNGSGSGLVGLEERVRLLGGDFSAGPRDGGFEVEAGLPLDDAGNNSAAITDAGSDAAQGEGSR